MNHRTADSVVIIVIAFIAALLGTFISWVMSFFFLERVWDKIVKPDADGDFTDLMEMSERGGKEPDEHLHFYFIIHRCAQCFFLF
jgi:hypothetical protein